MEIDEAFLHFIWRNLLFRQKNLLSFQGDKICIVSPGEINDNAGPDFLGANIILNDTVLLGNVEIHVKSSDWWHHNHSKNALYDNVILHVVWDNDKNVYCKKELCCPMLVLKDYVDDDVCKYIDILMDNSSDVFCQSWFVLHVNFKKLLHSRILYKIDDINKLFLANKNDFNATAFQFLMYNFGFKVNNCNMLSLAQSIPFVLVQKICHEYDVLLSLFLGQANLLGRVICGNVYNLRKSYDFLKTKYSLKTCKLNWYFFRTRPGNSPIKRIKQVVSLFYKNDCLFDLVMCKDVDAFRKKLSTIQPPLSKSSIDNLVINVFWPLIAFYNNLHQLPFFDVISRELCFIAPEKTRLYVSFFLYAPLMLLKHKL